MSAEAPTKLITAAEFLEMDFDVPVELVRGEIVYPYGEEGKPPAGTLHGVVCNNVGRELGDWAKHGGYGIVASNDSIVLLERGPDTVRGPDVYFISYSCLPNRRIPQGVLEVPPELAVEVLSPHDRWKDVWVKVGEFFAAGVNEVWIIDPQARTVRVIPAVGEPFTRSSTDQLIREELLPGFSLPVSELFPPDEEVQQ